MENTKILELLEQQRDELFDRLKNTTISGLYKEQYEEIKAGKVFFMDDSEEKTTSDLKRLLQDTSLDHLVKSKLSEYLALNNSDLIKYFQEEFERILTQIKDSGKQKEIQALFIAYDYYYHYTSSGICYGIQEYPVIEEPRYLRGEYDDTKQILIIQDAINFEPAWVSCEKLNNLDYLEINYELENLFVLHSRTLLHRALDILNSNGKLAFLNNRPFSFYINEHDSEVMMLYRLS